MARQILEMNDGERAWIVDNLLKIRELIRQYAPALPDQRVSLQALDEAFGAWLACHDPSNENANPIINAFGIAFGQILVDELQLEWAVVSDNQGTEIAVHGQPGDVLVFPTNFVAKRYVSRTVGFFEPIGEEMKRDIQRLQKSPAKASSWWKFWKRGG